MAVIVDRRGAEFWVWDVDILDWVRGTQPSGGTGGSGSLTEPVEIEDGGGSITVDGPLLDTARVTAGATGTSGSGNVLLPIGSRDTSNNTIKHIPMTTTPWDISAFGSPVLMVRETGATALQRNSSLTALNSNATVDCAANNVNSVTISIKDTSSFSGVITPRIAAADGVWNATTAYRVTDGLPVSTLAVGYTYVVYTSGMYYFEARVTAYTSGTAQAYLVASNAATVQYGSVNSTAVGASSATTSMVNDSATSVNLLVANPSRRSATFYNSSSEILYIKFGTTATTSDFTYIVQANDFWSMPVNYTGNIDGIWANNSTGAVHITELTL